MTTTPENVTRTSLLAVTQTAIGCGVGLLLARKLQPSAQKITALAILSLGIVTTLPIVVDLVQRNINRPESDRGMRRRLESIRQDRGWPEDADII